MGAQTLTEIYRSDERDGTFRASVVVTYFGVIGHREAYISALSSSVTRRCVKELEQHLRNNGVTRYHFHHRGRYVVRGVGKGIPVARF